MGSKKIVFCDACKNETEEDFTKLSFKKPGKSKGLNFEVCTACATKFQVQLVGDDSLDQAWSFNAPQSILPPLTGSEADDDDDRFIREKEAERKSLLKEFKPKANAAQVDPSECSHMNKSPIDPETFEQFCKDCGEPVSPPARRSR